MNGHDLKEMPVNGTPISEDLSREDGINLDTAGVTDITATQPVTVYYWLNRTKAHTMFL